MLARESEDEMSSYEKGCDEAARLLDLNQRDRPDLSLAEICQGEGELWMEELAYAQEQAQDDTLPEWSRERWNNSVEFYRGMLSRLD